MTMSMTFTLRFSCHFVFCYDWWSETYKTMSKEPIEPYLADAWHRRGFLSTVFVGLNPVTRLLFFTLMFFYFSFFQWERPGSFLRREGEGHGVGQKYGVAGCGEDQNYLWEGGGRRRERVRLKP